MVAEVLSQVGVGSDPRLTRPGEPGAVAGLNPATARPLPGVRADSESSIDRSIAEAAETFRRWRLVPAPQRGLVVRAIAEEFRRHKDALATLVTLEAGKIRSEALGEIQEIIDVADFAVGLSRQLYGLTMPSERPDHRIQETWHPLGPVGVITAFNFPAAVWGWNAMLAAVCGDTVVWKPSPRTPLTALACSALADRVATDLGHPGVFHAVFGPGPETGRRLAADRRLPLISATGSCAMGREVGSIVASRLGRALLELGGNNAAIIHADADLALAIPAVVFGAVGTAGQRCTTTRRLLVHEPVAEEVCTRLVAAYRTVRIGDPASDGVLMGPLIAPSAVRAFEDAIAAAKSQGGVVLAGGVRHSRAGEGFFVEPTIVRAPPSNHLPIAASETFAPILYVFTYRDLEHALALNNAADQGLSSAVFTASVRVAERFLGPAGSDCGIANVNAGTSGAEIGGAFGGEKDTGGGRESGSDSWKAYMRRQTATIHWGTHLALAQGIRFE